LSLNLEKVDKCPVCDHTEKEFFVSCTDYTVSKKEFTVVRCKNCSFTYTHPRPDQNEIGKYYQSENYISHTDTNKGLINKVYHIVRQKTLTNKLTLINNISNKGSLLDVGCGTGSFLEVCKNDGWLIEATEPDIRAKDIAENKLGIKIQTDLLQAFEGKHFDVITLWHVLEHIHALNQTVEKIVNLMNPEGKLVIAVPNIDSYDANYFGKYWAAYDLPRHLYHFSKKTLQKLMQKHGIKLDAIIPMKYDAYYISLLSTKYKNGSIRYYEALTQGVKSNVWAKKMMIIIQV
jgi:2-polyprenyl-3-methyl-5-hydroxy-6-metoxy-1,4-benzoquinol methylase